MLFTWFQGWRVHRMSFDPGSSLLLLVVALAQERQLGCDGDAIAFVGKKRAKDHQT